MKQVIIKTKDFTLRPITLSKPDILGYLACHQDKDAKKNFSNAPKNYAEAKKEVKKNIIHPYLLVIEVNNRFAGFVHLELNNLVRYKHSAILRYGLNKEFRGRGLATKATKVLSDYGFKKLKLVRITGWCRTFNKASAKVLKNAGFKLEGILKKTSSRMENILMI